jgi:uncharacterized RDD family membrane protein YckC
MNAIAQPSAASVSGSKLDNRRMLAALIDLAVVGAGGAAILVAAGVLGGSGSMSAPLAAVVAAWALYYYFACETGGGQTLGKKVLGLRVVTLDGRAPGMRDVAVRTVLRLIDTALVGLVSMLATGERRARLGDLAAGTIIVSTDAPKAAAAAAVAAPVAEETEAPAEPAVAETPPVPELRPFDPEPESDDAPDAPYRPVLGEGFEDEPVADEPTVAMVEPAASEPAADEPAEDDPVVELVQPHGDEPAGGSAAGQPAPAAEPASAPVELSVVEQPAVELSVVEAPPVVEPAPHDPAAHVEPLPGADEHSLDIATPTLMELARDVQAAKGAEPVAEVSPEPAVEVEIAGPEVDVDGPDVTVRSVETVSAMDLIMGGDEPAEDSPADEHPPATA